VPKANSNGKQNEVEPLCFQPDAELSLHYRLHSIMGRDRLVQAGPREGLLAGLLDGVAADMAAGNQAREEPLARGPGAPPVVAQDLQQPWREHDVAVLAALALLDADDHALAVDVGRAQADGFGDAQAGGVAAGQDGVVSGAGDTAEEVHGFPGAGYDGQLAGLPRGGQDFRDVPVLAEGDAVEEAQGRDGDADRAGRELPGAGQEQLVVADLLGAEPLRRLAEVAGEPGHLADVARLGVGGQVANGHVLRHALAQWCHENAPLRYRMGCAAKGSHPMLPQSELAGKPGNAWGIGPTRRTQPRQENALSPNHQSRVAG